MSIGAISSSLAAPYAIVRAANDDRAAANAASRQADQDVENKVSELTAQAQAAASQDRQADAARQQASLVQATTGAILNVYA
jgi:hypothetical protein